MKTKICNSCGKETLISDFRPMKDRRSGEFVPSGQCKICFNKKRNERRKINKIKFSDSINHKNIVCIDCDKLLPGSDFSFEINSDGKPIYNNYCKKCEYIRRKESKSKNIEYHKDYHRKASKRYYVKNKHKIEKYQIDNKHKINEKQAKYQRERKQKDIIYRIMCNISRAFNRVFIKNGRGSGQLMEYLGYDQAVFILHIESLFSHPDNLTPDGKVWMNWNNYGVYRKSKWNDNDPSTWTWQIDHIIPQATLKFTSIKDDNFKKCWSLDNLRPYSSKQNYLDGSSRVRHIKQ